MRTCLLAFSCVALALLLWPEGNGAPIKLGWWHGRSSQELMTSFHVAEDEEGLWLDEWQTPIDLRCEETGRVLHGVGVGTGAPIRDSGFSADHFSLRIWHRFGGRFDGSGHASGRLESVWPVLTGRAREALGTEKCTALDLEWTAEPGAPDDPGQDDSFDLVLHVAPDGTVSTTIPARAGSGGPSPAR